jgi:Uncharacterized protein conserved in bacteria
MKKKLIIVADDYGFSEAYSIGALKAYKEGVVTVLSLMPNMEAASFAVDLAKKEAPEACLVQHTNFVQGRPCCKPVELPSMVDENGMFYRSSKWKSERAGDTKSVGNVVVTKEDCILETKAQLERFRELTGAYPIHFEGHSVGTRAVSEAFVDVSRENGIHCSELPELETDRMKIAHEIFRDMKDFSILNNGCRVENFLNDDFGILNNPYEINVLHFHPGYLDAYLLDNTSLTLPRCRDLEALCDPRVRNWITENKIELVDFSAVYR